MKKILFSAFAFLISTSAFSQWTTQSSAFATPSRGIAALEVYNANTVWAFGVDGSGAGANVQEFTKTTNGGTTWTSGAINVGNPDLHIASISGVDANTAWVATFDNTDGLGTVFKTTNGGSTWVSQLTFTTAGESWMNYVHFFDANNGIAGGDPESGYFEIYTTSNGGTTWSRVPLANIPAPLTDEYGYNGGYYTVGDNIFFYTGKGRIIKSTNKGLNWTVGLTTGTITDFGSATVNGKMAWSDANRGIVLRKTFNASGTPTAMTLHRTTNGGTSWSAVTYTGITMANRISDITYVPGTNILVATSDNGTSGGSWKSVDNGTTWTAIDNLVQHLGVRCYDANTCYSGGFSTSSTVGGMFKLTASLGTNETSTKIQSINIFPNPTTGEINIKTDKKIKSSTVLDMSGKSLMTTNSQKADISSLPKGVYMIKVDFADGSTSTEKIIKE
ncbi:hypothetical protein M2347_001484 [Chryseobacterium sp. H1D6B]|uniref:T9SS type A sorting domain-containing protein n=1 Tax=Chryseobacterium sp. H1D6B TaxID=2940588 RepID=UPI0015C69A5A|nr:T9SS type A sorting domain-containing protein [Chryseobacterium sp. H1D6B]MDH6251757.1 hypothetical protein [Chryseobacterium sp. H1D6B]